MVKHSCGGDAAETEGGGELALKCRRLSEIRTAQDVGDLEQMVVDDTCQVVRGKVISSPDDDLALGATPAQCALVGEERNPPLPAGAGTT